MVQTQYFTEWGNTNMKIKHKDIFIGGIIGGIYALIPTIVQIFLKAYINQIWLIPFKMSMFTMSLLISPLLGLAESGLSSTMTNIILITSILSNIILWVIIGAVIAYLIEEKMKIKTT